MSDAANEARDRLVMLAKAVRIWRHRQADGRVRYTVYDEISEKPYVPDAFSDEAVPVEDR